MTTLSISNSQSWQNAYYAFQQARFRACLRRFLARLSGKSGHLVDFHVLAPTLSPTRTYRGIQDILVTQITGSLDRAADFDARFGPLDGHMQDRWMRIHLLWQEKSAWPLIQVVKVGPDYYVEDGHHRVSVARSLGMAYIQAEVWESTPRLQPAPWVCPIHYPFESPRPVEVCKIDSGLAFLRKD